MKIRDAINKLLGPDGQDILDALDNYEDYRGWGVTYTGDNGRNIASAVRGSSHVRACHAIQTTMKQAEFEARQPEGNLVDRALSCTEKVAARAKSTTLNRSLQLAGLNRIPAAGQTRQDTKRNQVKEVRNAFDHFSRLPSADDIPEL